MDVSILQHPLAHRLAHRLEMDRWTDRTAGFQILAHA